jgi:NUMOD4 motif
MCCMFELPVERWLPVVGYEGYYEVSNLVRVRSLDRITCRGHKIKGALLHQYLQ